jgi:hypothetical protein
MSETLSFELKKLSPAHKQVAALVAQGVDRRTIAAACDFTPEYVTMLQGQPLFVEYIKGMNRAVATQLEALFGKSVDVINNAMDTGNIDEQLKGAKLQLEATGRIGRFATIAPEAGGQDRLEQLSERLLGLLKSQRRVANGEVIEGEVVRFVPRTIQGGSGQETTPVQGS